MTSARTFDPRGIDARPPVKASWRTGAVWALEASVTNAAIWAIGRLADVSFSVTPVTSDSAMRLGIVEVALTTAFAFAAGWALLSWATRRSHRAVRGVLITAAAFAVLSTSGPAVTANDTATAVLLIAMHLATGATFLVAASVARSR